jgi:hypothetical protein
MNGAKKGRGATQFACPNVKTATQAYKQTYRGQCAAAAQDPFLLCGNTKTDKYDLGFACRYVLQYAIVWLPRGVKIPVMTACDNQVGELLLHLPGGGSGHAVLSTEKINRVTACSCQLQNTFSRFDAGQAVT